MPLYRLMGALACAFLMQTSTSLASTCSTDETISSIRLADALALKYVPAYFLGGKAIASAVTDCTTAEDSSYEVDVEITWRGVILYWNEYAIRGTYTSSDLVETKSFQATWGNDKVRELEFWGNILEHAVEIVASSR